MQYNFFQSKIRQEIQEINGKKIIKIQINGKNFRGITKSKKIGPLKFQRIQILGADFMLLNKNSLKQLKKQLKKYFMLQFGFTNIFFQSSVQEFKNLKKNKIEKENLCKNREKLDKKIYKLGLKKSFRENMPPATIIYENKNLDKNISTLAKRMIKKAKKENLKINLFSQNPQEKILQNIHKTRKKTLNNKKISVLPFQTFKKLVYFLLKNNKGELYFCTKNGEILSASLILFFENSLVYLYGFSDRNYSKTGAHYFLHYQISQINQEKFKYFDTLGVSPICQKHNLDGVTNFKNKFGGEFIEFYGNFDLIIKPFQYILFKFYRISKKFL